MNGRAVASKRSGDREAFAITLSVQMSAVEAGRLALLAYLERFAIDDIALNRIEVILEELVSNVVRHGEGADVLQIEAEYTGQAIRLVIEDNGPVFNPFEAPEPSPFTTVENATLGRQGIPLIRRLSKSVHYHRIGSVNRTTAVIAAH